MRRVRDRWKLTRGLGLVGRDAEVVHVDTGGGLGVQVGERLHLREVRTLALLETILAVELQLQGSDGRIPIVRGLLVASGVGGVEVGGVLAVLGTLHGPREETGGVVEVEAVVGGADRGAGGDSLRAGVLQLGDQVCEAKEENAQLFLEGRAAGGACIIAKPTHTRGWSGRSGGARRCRGTRT